MDEYDLDFSDLSSSIEVDAQPLNTFKGIPVKLPESAGKIKTIHDLFQSDESVDKFKDLIKESSVIEESIHESSVIEESIHESIKEYENDFLDYEDDFIDENQVKEEIIKYSISLESLKIPDPKDILVPDPKDLNESQVNSRNQELKPVEMTRKETDTLKELQKELGLKQGLEGRELLERKCTCGGKGLSYPMLKIMNEFISSHLNLLEEFLEQRKTSMTISTYQYTT